MHLLCVAIWLKRLGHFINLNKTYLAALPKSKIWDPSDASSRASTLGKGIQMR